MWDRWGPLWAVGSMRTGGMCGGLFGGLLGCDLKNEGLRQSAVFTGVLFPVLGRF
jgi:hypothetical protein